MSGHPVGRDQNTGVGVAACRNVCHSLIISRRLDSARRRGAVRVNGCFEGSSRWCSSPPAKRRQRSSRTRCRSIRWRASRPSSGRARGRSSSSCCRRPRPTTSATSSSWRATTRTTGRSSIASFATGSSRAAIRCRRIRRKPRSTGTGGLGLLRAEINGEKHDRRHGVRGARTGQARQRGRAVLRVRHRSARARRPVHRVRPGRRRASRSCSRFRRPTRTPTGIRRRAS